MLLAIVCGAMLVIHGPRRELGIAFGVALAGIVAVSFGWLLVSVFWPAEPDRTCPECGLPKLRRKDPASMRGVVCEECGSQDPDRSAFLFAEEEDGAIEPLVTRERARCQERAR
jgi:hypothetical protein